MSAKTTAYDSQASSRLARFAATGLTALAFLGAMGAGIAFLQHRADAQPMPERNPPVTVATEPVSIVNAYEVEERFTGRLEPARRTSIAFERGGLVTALEGADCCRPSDESWRRSWGWPKQSLPATRPSKPRAGPRDSATTSHAIG